MHWIEIYPFDCVMHHLNNWGLEQDENGESASPRARWGEATFKGIVVVWSRLCISAGLSLAVEDTDILQCKLMQIPA